jgi:hypothetical protein
MPITFASAVSDSNYETTRESFFCYVIEKVHKDGEIRINGELVTAPSKETREQRLIPRWGRIFTALVLIGLGGFTCAKLAGF